MTDRRPVGSLEAEVLAILWQRDTAATPAQVLELVSTDLAYTTVMTILHRLWQKGLVGRERIGRAYAYRPLLTEAEFAARNMQAALAKSRDRVAVLHRFVDGLSQSDAALLRDLVRRATPE